MVLINLLFAIFFTLSAAPITAPCILAQDLFPAPNNTVTFPARKNGNEKKELSFDNSFTWRHHPDLNRG